MQVVIIAESSFPKSNRNEEDLEPSQECH